jgi:hypothetical protein
MLRKRIFLYDGNFCVIYLPFFYLLVDFSGVSYEEGEERPTVLPPLQPGWGQEQHPGRDYRTSRQCCGSVSGFRLDSMGSLDPDPGGQQ